MKIPKKRTGGRWLVFGVLLLAMGVCGYALRKSGVRRLNLNSENELLDLLGIFCELMMKIMTEHAAALLIDGVILLVIAFAKKTIRAKQIECWENHRDLDETWYGFQRFLAVLLPTLSAWFLTNAFVAHLTGIEDAGRIIFESGPFGISMTKDFAYRRSFSIFILNYFCTLGLMIYWRNISLIPESSTDKFRMSLLALPCVFLVNYVLVRAFYNAVAAFLPPVMAVIGACVLGCVTYPIARFVSLFVKEETEEEYKRRMDALERQINKYREEEHYDRIHEVTEFMPLDEKDELISRFRPAQDFDEVYRAITRNDWN